MSVSACPRCGVELSLYLPSGERDDTESHTPDRCADLSAERARRAEETARLADDLRRDAVIRCESAIEMHRVAVAKLAAAREALRERLSRPMLMKPSGALTATQRKETEDDMVAGAQEMYRVFLAALDEGKEPGK